MKKAKKKGIDPKVTSCCGAKKIKVAGILRCESCQRETIISHTEKGHMYDAHDWNFQRGFEDSEGYY